MDHKTEYLYDQIDEELDDAHAYVKKAMKCKGDNLELANTLVRLSGEELQHAQTLISFAAMDVAALEKTMHEAASVHKWLHGRFEHRIAEIKQAHEEYRKI